MIRVAGLMIEIRVGRIPTPFPASVHAVTVWPFIFYEAQVWDDKCVQVHDRYHWVDQLRWLWVPWFAAYLILRVVQMTGSRGHLLEKEAYRRQDECKAAAED